MSYDYVSCVSSFETTLKLLSALLRVESTEANQAYTIQQVHINQVNISLEGNVLSCSNKLNKIDKTHSTSPNKTLIPLQDYNKEWIIFPPLTSSGLKLFYFVQAI